MRTCIVAIVAFGWAVHPASAADLRIAEAAKRQDASAVRALVKQHVDVNVPLPDGATALHWVVLRDDIETAAALVGAGAHLDAANDYGVTPLSLAANNGSLRMVTLLLTGGATPDRPLVSGETPLMTAARVGSVTVAAALVEKGANVNHQEAAKGQTALMWALFEDHMDVVRFLIERGADVGLRSSTGMTPLLFAARSGNLDAVTLLLAKGADIEGANADGVTPLLMATVRGHAEVITYLLDRGADANTSKTGFAPLHWAAGTWETSMTHDYPEAEGEWRALGGLGERKSDIIKALVAHGADVNARSRKSPPRFGINMFVQIQMAGATPFWIAAMSTDADTMRLLAALGADAKQTTEEGVTPLMVAAGVGRVEGDSLLGDPPSIAAAQVCLDLGNDINAQSKYGETALHGAAWFGLDGVARFLVEHGADMTLKDTRQGQTPQEVAEGTTRTLLFRTHPSTAKVLRDLASARGIVASSATSEK